MDVRRNILECSRAMIHTLQSFEKLEKIREIKIKRIKQLRTVGKELELLISKLKVALPKTNMRAAEVDARPSTIKKGINDLDKLEDQLKAIESEINKLG